MARILRNSALKLRNAEEHKILNRAETIYTYVVGGCGGGGGVGDLSEVLWNVGLFSGLA